MNFTESFKKHLKESSQREDELVWELINYLYDKYGENFTVEDNVNGLTDRAEIYDSLAKQYMEENPEVSFTEYVQNIIDDPHGLLVITSDLTESDNSMKDKFIEFKRQVHSDFEQFEEDMMNDDTDVFSGTEDSYANEMIWEHLSDTVYYLLEDKFDADRIYDLTNAFTSKLIDAYNENKLDDEIGRVFATYMYGLNESEETSIKLTKDTRDQVEVGDILADNSNRYVVVNIIDYPRSKAVTVRNEKDWSPPIYGDPISNWYGTTIIKGPFIRKDGKVFKEAENNNAAYVICYGTLEIWPDKDSAREYYEEGIAMSEGAEQQRYGNIAFALYKGNNFGDDEGPEMVTKIVDKNTDGSDKSVRTHCGRMTHEQAFDYINKLQKLIPENEETNGKVYECNDCGKEFEDGQLFNTDADGNVLCPYCGSGDIIKEE